MQRLGRICSNAGRCKHQMERLQGCPRSHKQRTSVGVVCSQVKWPKTLLVVSHAREFLNAVTTDTIHLHSKKLTVYKGAPPHRFDACMRAAAVFVVVLLLQSRVMCDMAASHLKSTLEPIVAQVMHSSPGGESAT